MSRSYHFEVEVEGVGEDRQEAVIRAVGKLWAYNSDYSSGFLDYEGLRFTGYEEIGGSDPAGGFARYLSPDIWAAAGGYRPIRVYAILEDHDPDDEFESTEEDYEAAAPTDPGEATPDCIPAAAGVGGEEVPGECPAEPPVGRMARGPARGRCERFGPEDLAKRTRSSGMDEVDEMGIQADDRETSGGKLIGPLDNDPVSCPGLGLGDAVEVAMGEIERVAPESSSKNPISYDNIDNIAKRSNGHDKEDLDGGRISGEGRSDGVAPEATPARQPDDDYDTNPLALPIDFSRLMDLFGDGSYLRGWLSIGGALHHLELLLVRDDESGVQGIGDPGFSETYAWLQRMYPGRYETIRVPGREGQYIAHMLPRDVSPV